LSDILRDMNPTCTAWRRGFLLWCIDFYGWQFVGDVKMKTPYTTPSTSYSEMLSIRPFAIQTKNASMPLLLICVTWLCCSLSLHWKHATHSFIGRRDKAMATAWVLMWAYVGVNLGLCRKNCRWTWLNIGIVLSANGGLCRSVCQKYCWWTWLNIEMALSANIGLCQSVCQKYCWLTWSNFDVIFGVFVKVLFVDIIKKNSWVLVWAFVKGLVESIFCGHNVAF
jgi:hypothetical protein